jgi:hypothetical protein
LGKNFVKPVFVLKNFQKGPKNFIEKSSIFHENFKNPKIISVNKGMYVFRTVRKKCENRKIWEFLGKNFVKPVFVLKISIGFQKFDQNFTKKSKKIVNFHENFKNPKIISVNK